MHLIELFNCADSNITNSSSNSTVLNLKDVLTVPSLIVLTGTLVLAVIILVALVLSQCYKSSNSIFYFNLSLADIIMAFVSIIMFIPNDSLSWNTYQIFGSVEGILRQVWSLTVVCLMINRYKLILGKPGFTVRTTYVVILFTWIASILQTVYWSLRAPGGSLNYLRSCVAGVVFDNVMLLNYALPLPVVVTLLVLILLKARQHLARIKENYSQDTALQLGTNLRLLYAFGVVYILGFGLEFVVSVNSLVNLSGYLDIVPLWKKSATFCGYLFGFDEVANMVLNFTNSLIIVQSRHVQCALKKMYRATSQGLRNVSNVKKLRKRDDHTDQEERSTQEI